LLTINGGITAQLTDKSNSIGRRWRGESAAIKTLRAARSVLETVN